MPKSQLLTVFNLVHGATTSSLLDDELTTAVISMSYDVARCRLAEYVGAVLLQQWKTIMARKKLMWSGTHSQCRLHSIGLLSNVSQLRLLSPPSFRGRQRRTSFGWEGKGRCGSLR